MGLQSMRWISTAMSTPHNMGTVTTKSHNTWTVAVDRRFHNIISNSSHSRLLPPICKSKPISVIFELFAGTPDWFIRKISMYLQRPR